MVDVMAIRDIRKLLIYLSATNDLDGVRLIFNHPVLSPTDENLLLSLSDVQTLLSECITVAIKNENILVIHYFIETKNPSYATLQQAIQDVAVCNKSPFINRCYLLDLFATHLKKHLNNENCVNTICLFEGLLSYIKLTGDVNAFNYIYDILTKKNFYFEQPILSSYDENYLKNTICNSSDFEKVCVRGHLSMAKRLLELMRQFSTYSNPFEGMINDDFNGIFNVHLEMMTPLSSLQSVCCIIGRYEVNGLVVAVGQTSTHHSNVDNVLSTDNKQAQIQNYTNLAKWLITEFAISPYQVITKMNETMSKTQINELLQLSLSLSNDKAIKITPVVISKLISFKDNAELIEFVFATSQDDVVSTIVENKDEIIRKAIIYKAKYEDIQRFMNTYTSEPFDMLFYENHTLLLRACSINNKPFINTYLLKAKEHNVSIPFDVYVKASQEAMRLCEVDTLERLYEACGLKMLIQLRNLLRKMFNRTNTPLTRNGIALLEWFKERDPELNIEIKNGKLTTTINIKLPIKLISAVEVDLVKTQCCVCLEDKFNLLTECGHEICEECATSIHNMSDIVRCPYCRAEVHVFKKRHVNQCET